MSEKELDDLVETIMRSYYMGSYEKYNNEEIRNQWKKRLRSDNDGETLVREQSGRGKSNC